MHGVAVFKHYEVCDVNVVVDGAYAAGTESFNHPAGRRSDLYVLYLCRHVSGAELCIFNRNGKLSIDIAAAALEGGSFNIKGSVEGCACFTCKTDNGKTVGAVVCDFKFNADVVKTYRLAYIVAHLHLVEIGVIIENKHSVGRGVGEITVIHAQLIEGAEHTAAYFAS